MKAKKYARKVAVRARPAAKRVTNLSHSGNGICGEDGVYVPKGYSSPRKAFVEGEPFPEYPKGSGNYEWVRVG